MARRIGMTPDLRKTAEQLVAVLRAGEGWDFRSLSIEERGEYHPDDADWNYKDIPHARFVHDTIEGYMSYVSDPMITSVMTQKVGPFTFPLTMVLYSSRPDRQTYHTSFGPFVMIVETRWEALGENQARVVTTYHIGGTPRILRLAWPLWQRMLRRNYATLMKDDLLMRRRRGSLRRRGYRFVRVGEGTYSYAATLDIMTDHVVIPERAVELRVPIASLAAGSTVQLGDDDAFGVQARRSDGRLDLYPRLCPHEGACLDTSSAVERVACPWHGRVFAPVALHLSEGAEAVCGAVRVRVSGAELVMTSLSTTPASVPPAAR